MAAIMSTLDGLPEIADDHKLAVMAIAAIQSWCRFSRQVTASALGIVDRCISQDGLVRDGIQVMYQVLCLYGLSEVLPICGISDTNEFDSFTSTVGDLDDDLGKLYQRLCRDSQEFCLICHESNNWPFFVCPSECGKPVVHFLCIGPMLLTADATCPLCRGGWSRGEKHREWF